MLSTSYPQLILLVVNFLTLACNSLISYVLLKKLVHVRALERDVRETKLDIGDLTDRFTTFQKREGMREARAKKQTDIDLLADLQAAAAAPAEVGGLDHKSKLRRKLRGLN